MRKTISPYYYLIAAATAVYLYLTFNTPANPVSMARYNLTAEGLFLLRVSFIIPILFIWFAGTYAFASLSRYVKMIRGTWEEAAFKNMLIGIGIFFWGGVVASSLISVVGNYIGHGVSNYPLKPVFTILSNYFAVLPMLIGFIFILLSAKIFFAHLNNGKRISLAWKVSAGAILSVVAYISLELIFSDANRSMAPEGGVATYYLKDSILIFTVIMPLFLSWIIGAVATKYLSMYGSFVEGKVYKHLFINLSLGLNSLIILSMFLRTLTSIGTGRLASLGLTSIVLIIYLIFLIMGVAYVFIAKGVSSLSRIETV